MQGHKASDCTVKKQRMNTVNGNKGENMKNNCFNCGKPVTTAKTAQNENLTLWAGTKKLFVGHVGEDCVYIAQEQKPAHKTNRDWHLDTSSSDNSNSNMNMEEDSDESDTTRVTSNTTNFNNNNNIVSLDVNDTEEYEPKDPEDFEAKITEITSDHHYMRK
jgi:hypothetical protein